jgi:NADPH:quinone reductase-like Zn-dependent oxidoreductase
MLPDELAAMFRINPPTALRLLDRVSLRPGDWVIVNAAGSMVGRLMTALGRQRGLRMLNVVRDTVPLEARLMSLGATAVIDDGDDLPQRALAIMGEPARLAVDFVTGGATGRLAQCLGKGGRLTVAGHLDPSPCSVPSAMLTGSSIVIDGFSLRPAEAGEGRDELISKYHPLARLYDDHPALRPHVVRFGATDFAAALRHGGGARALLDWGRVDRSAGA